MGVAVASAVGMAVRHANQLANQPEQPTVSGWMGIDLKFNQLESILRSRPEVRVGEYQTEGPGGTT